MRASLPYSAEQGIPVGLGVVGELPTSMKWLMDRAIQIPPSLVITSDGFGDNTRCVSGAAVHIPAQEGYHGQGHGRVIT